MEAWKAAEERAATFLTRLGFFGVEVESGGADGGVDLRVPGLIVAQVKATNRPVGRPVIQQIYGIGQAEGAHSAVFSLSGYSKQAMNWANGQTVSLFVFRQSAAGVKVVPRNPAAHALINYAVQEHGVSPNADQLVAGRGLRHWSKVLALTVLFWLFGTVRGFFCLLCLGFLIVASCLDQSDRSPEPRPESVSTSRCPVDDLGEGEICPLDPEMDGYCEFRPPAERSESWEGIFGHSILCPYGYEYKPG
mgnify:CR=1 FL=1